eukprot:gene11047-23098_t
MTKTRLLRLVFISFSFGIALTHLVQLTSSQNRVSTITSGETEKRVPYYNKLNAQCMLCMGTSIKRYKEDGIGRDREGSWVDSETLEILKDMLHDLKPSRHSKTTQFISTSTLPLHVILHKCSEYDITMLHAPKYSSFPARKHNPGTIILHQVIYGTGYIRTFLRDREIKYDVLDDNQILRMGGASRVFGAAENGPTAMIEIALHPPRRDDEGFGYVGGFEGKGNMLSIDVSEDEISKMFLSAEEFRAAYFDENMTKMDENMAVLSTLKQSVGGLSTEIESLIRRVLASRGLKPSALASLGLSHVRGVLLYGPPGCGKTLIARELARALNAREPKIVNGPEILDKFVGEAERNIRSLFADAEEEWTTRGPDSALHVIIFDELDAIAKVRGSLGGDGSGVRDSVVNQLLAMLDGVKSLGNVLVVGLTNRKELIDPALLRPGRLEVHLEIRPPDRRGREEVLEILLRPMAAAGHLCPADALDDWVSTIARRTSGWTGADLTGLVRSAASFAILRQQAYRDAARARGGVSDLDEGSLSGSSVVLLWKDFEKAFKEVNKPRNSRLLAVKEMVRYGLQKIRKPSILTETNKTSDNKDAQMDNGNSDVKS